jgi:hypothetical protein
MSRSIKKHCGGKICCCSSDKISKQFWHRTARRHVNVQLRTGTVNRNFDDIVFWKKKQEVSDTWSFASDGGSHWQYLDFEHFYCERLNYYYQSSTGPYSRYAPFAKYPNREEVWQEWITEMVGK